MWRGKLPVEGLKTLSFSPEKFHLRDESGNGKLRAGRTKIERMK